MTIPFSHLPTLLLAFVVNQLIHELGHALGGALYVASSHHKHAVVRLTNRDEIQMTRFSFNLHGILPSATVSFPSTLDSLTTFVPLCIVEQCAKTDM